MISYGYDAGGNRISKQVQVGNGAVVKTYYVRDAQGNVLGVYKNDGGQYVWEEQHLYGSSRLGMVKAGQSIATGQPLVNDSYNPDLDVLPNNIVGKRLYELTNHLGNVLAVITDNKLPYCPDPNEAMPCGTDGTGQPQLCLCSESPYVYFYQAEVLSQSDYYPFGMGMAGRKFSAGGEYRYGFNGQEKSTEIDPNGNSMTAEFWQYDARIGRRWNVDPRPSVAISVYAAFANNPIYNSDPLGDKSIKRPDGYNGEEIPDFATINSLSKPGKVKGTNVAAAHTDGAVESFTIGNKTFNASYRTSDGMFTGYKSGEEYYSWDLYRDAINAVGDYGLAGSLINAGYGPEKILEMSKKLSVLESLKANSLGNMLKGIVNDFYITGKALMSGPLGYSKSGITDLDGNTVGYNQRISSGINTFTSFVPMSGAPRGINFMYSIGGYRIFGTRFFKLHPRLTNIGVEGLGHGQFDAAHRATAFLRDDILKEGSAGFRNSSTLYFNYNSGGQPFSIGINPWKRTIFHEGTGVFK